MKSRFRVANFVTSSFWGGGRFIIETATKSSGDDGHEVSGKHIEWTFDTGNYLALPRSLACFCPYGAVLALKLFFGTVLAAAADINFHVTWIFVPKLCGLLRIHTHFLFTYVYIFIILSTARLSVIMVYRRSRNFCR